MDTHRSDSPQARIESRNHRARWPLSRSLEGVIEPRFRSGVVFIAGNQEAQRNCQGGGHSSE